MKKENRQKKLNIAVVGNPNCGKTALYNALTNSQQRVGNWAGVTVSCQHGTCKINNKQKVNVIDLPGCYSLLQHQQPAPDQETTKSFLQQQQPDLIINVIDASNLNRNLYLSSQLIQQKIPMIIALNMMDVAKQQNIKIDIQELSNQLGCVVIPMVAHRHQGIDKLINAIAKYAKESETPKTNNQDNQNAHKLISPIPCSAAINELQKQISSKYSASQREWVSWALLEQDDYFLQQLNDAQRNTLQQLQQCIKKTSDEDADTWCADARYTWADEITNKVQKCEENKSTFTHKLDTIFLHRWLGLPLFLFIMYLMFVLAINVGGAFQDFFDISSDTLLVQGVAQGLTAIHCPTWLNAILSTGLGKGINTTITFIPVIAMMFFCMSFLEDSGYLARAAFIVDRCMQRLGLPGQAFVPMIVGFGCNVPAVMATRTLKQPHERIISTLMIPFMTCGARLAIFAVFAAAFFPHGGQNIIFALYCLGIIAAVFTAWLVRYAHFPRTHSTLIMELPNYHRPHWRSLWRHTWRRLKHFIFRAGKVILPVCIILGTLNHITPQGKLLKQTNQNSVLATIGKKITPVFHPMGISNDNWPATVGLFTGVMAKEVVVGSLNSLYAQAGGYHLQAGSNFSIKDGMRDALQSIPANIAALPDAIFNPIVASAAPHDVDQRMYGMLTHRFHTTAAAIAYLVFILLYFPCVSTMAVIKRELGSRWMQVSVAWNTILAYGAAVFCYQVSVHTATALIAFSSSIITLILAAMLYRQKNKFIAKEVKT